MASDLDIPRYFAADVAKAAGIDVVTLQNWLRTGAIVMEKEDRKASGAGSRRLFTARTAIQIAVIAELVAYGVPPLRASKAVLAATDSSDRLHNYPDNPDTYALIFISAGTDVFTIGIKWAEMSIEETFQRVAPVNGKPARSVLMVNMTDIAKQVRESLEIGTD